MSEVELSHLEERLRQLHAGENRVQGKDIKQSAETLGLTLLDEPIQPGDMYLAGRNTGVHLLTCKSIKYRESGFPHWIYPVEDAYPFDAYECFKVVEKS